MEATYSNEVPLLTGEKFADQFDVEAKEPEEIQQTPPPEIPDPTKGTPSAPPPEQGKATEPGKENFFAKEDLEPEANDYVPEIKKWSKAQMDADMETFLNLRNFLQSELLALLAGESETEMYEMDERELNKLAKAWAPVYKKYGYKIPDWAMIPMTEGLILIPLVKRAWTDGKVNRANRRMAADPDLQQTVHQAVQNKVRKSYAIDGNGFYKGGSGRDYIKEKDRVEKASIADIENIVRDNPLAIVKKVFPTLDYTKYE